VLYTLLASYRLTAGLDKGGYYNERFLRGRIDLVANIQRVKVKGTGVRAKANPEDEPNLYFYPAIDSAASKAGITTINTEAAADVDMVMSSDDCQKVPAFETEDPPLSTTTMMPPPPRQVLPLPTSMMMVPRNYDKVQDSLEQNAERLIQDQKQKQLRSQHVGGLLDQAMVTSSSAMMVPDETREPTYVDVNFDKLIDEMFRHDQSLDFSDLLKLAAV